MTNKPISPLAGAGRAAKDRGPPAAKTIRSPITVAAREHSVGHPVDLCYPSPGRGYSSFARHLRDLASKLSL